MSGSSPGRLIIMEDKMATRKIGRDAPTGRFIPVDKARRNPRTTTVETVKIKPRTKR